MAKKSHKQLQIIQYANNLSESLNAVNNILDQCQDKLNTHSLINRLQTSIGTRLTVPDIRR